MGLIRKANTPEAQAIWREVEEAARQCPEWVKPVAEQAAEDDVKRIRERAAALAGKGEASGNGNA